MKLFTKLFDDHKFMAEASDPTRRRMAIAKTARRKTWAFIGAFLGVVLSYMALWCGESARVLVATVIMFLTFLAFFLSAQADLRLLRAIEMLQTTSEKR